MVQINTYQLACQKLIGWCRGRNNRIRQGEADKTERVKQEKPSTEAAMFDITAIYEGYGVALRSRKVVTVRL